MPIAYIALVIFAIIVNYDQVSDLAGNERLQDCLLQVAKNLFILLMLMSGWQTRFVHPFSPAVVYFTSHSLPVCLLLQCIRRPGSSSQVETGELKWPQMFSAVQDVLEPAGGDDEQGEGGEEEEEGEERRLRGRVELGRLRGFPVRGSQLGAHGIQVAQDNLCITLKLLIRMYRGVSSLMELGSRGKEN